jgi:hypothetical protein
MMYTLIDTCDHVVAVRAQAKYLDRRSAGYMRAAGISLEIVRACLLVPALGLALLACNKAGPSATHDRENTLPGVSRSPIIQHSSVDARSLADELPSATFNEVPAFNDYPASLDNGTTQLPDFNNQFRSFGHYRSAIVSEMRDGVNFAGHMAIVHLGCGTECSFSYVADLQTGNIYATPITLHTRQHKVEYQPNSKLLIIYRTKGPWRPEPSISDVCVMDSYIWQGRGFTLLSSRNSVGQCPEEASTVHSDAYGTSG